MLAIVQVSRARFVVSLILAQKLVAPSCLAQSACSLELISYGIVFFSHNKSVLANLSAAETITQTAP
jgi:hypothetical protein